LLLTLASVQVPFAERLSTTDGPVPAFAITQMPARTSRQRGHATIVPPGHGQLPSARNPMAIPNRTSLTLITTSRLAASSRVWAAVLIQLRG
jgi:hypothetical protein